MKEMIMHMMPIMHIIFFLRRSIHLPMNINQREDNLGQEILVPEILEAEFLRAEPEIQGAGILAIGAEGASLQMDLLSLPQIL